MNTPYTLSGGGQSFASSVLPVYDRQAHAWRCQDANGNAFNVSDPTGQTFAIGGTPYPDLSPMQFYNAFAVGERISIKNSADLVMQEAWFTVQTAINTNTPIVPSVVQKILEYASMANQEPKPGFGVYLPGALTPVAAWTPGATVAAGQSLAVGNMVYTYTTAGTTATTGSGPSGTGGAITDGTATCGYTATPYILPARIPQILAGTPQ